MMKISFANSLQIFDYYYFLFNKKSKLLKKFHRKYSEVKDYKKEHIKTK